MLITQPYILIPKSLKTNTQNTRANTAPTNNATIDGKDNAVTTAATIK